MLSKNLPIAQPARLNGFGHPWHGRVTNVTLTAADGTERAYPQPDGVGDSARYTYGATHLLRRVDAPGAGELITKPGQQWADYALLAGETNQLYATPLGGGSWVYVAPDSSRWRVDCPLHGQAVDFGGPLSTTITLTRFGMIGGEGKSYELPISLADIGQPGPIDSDSYDSLITSGTLSVESITSTGGRAVLMLYLGIGNETPRGGYFRPNPRRAIGYLDISITGIPGDDAAVLLSVLRNRDATLGSIGDYFQDDQYMTFSGQFVGAIAEEVYSEESGPGYTDRIWTPTDVQYVPYDPNAAYAFAADVYAGNGQRFQTGRIIALAFDANDQLQEWHTDTYVDYTNSAPEPTQTIVGNPMPETRIRVYDDGRPNETISTYERVFSRTRQQSATVSFALYRGAQLVAQFGATVSRTDTVTTEQTPSQAHYEHTVTVTGEGGGLYESSGVYEDDFRDGGSKSLGASLQMNGWTPGASGGDWVNFYHPDLGNSSAAYVVRYSNNLIGIIVDGPFGAPSNAQSWFQSVAASPSAVHTITPRVDDVPGYYGSWNPATGEAIFAEPNPVCWV